MLKFLLVALDFKFELFKFEFDELCSNWYFGHNLSLKIDFNMILFATCHLWYCLAVGFSLVILEYFKLGFY